MALNVMLDYYGAEGLELPEIFKKAVESNAIGAVTCLSTRADVTADNNWALRYASKFGYKKIVKLLLEKGADPKARNSKALRDALAGGHFDIVILLEKSLKI